MANNEILRAARANSELAGMACVLTLAVLENGSAVVGHVGDSRLYQVRRGEIRKVTHDHSPVGEREDNRELSEADAMRHPRRNEVFRDVGSEEHTPDDADFIELTSVPFDSESALLLCSDGLSDQVASRGDSRRRGTQCRQSGGGGARVDRRGQSGRRQGQRHGADGGRRAVHGAAAAAAPAASPLPGPRARCCSPRDSLRPLALGWLTRTMWQPAPVAITPRVIAVTSTIAAAMADGARRRHGGSPGGEYREQVRLKDGVTLRARVPREPKLRAAPLSGGPAVIAEGVKGARFSGFRILADPQMPLSVGILLRDSAVEIDDVEVKGAGVGIEIRGSAKPRAARQRDSRLPGGRGVDAGTGNAVALAQSDSGE